MPRYVYQFGAGEADGRGDQKELLGGKGANLAEMTALGIPVPPGFTITTDVCSLNLEDELPDGLQDQVVAALARVGELTENGFGDAAEPLLVSVRSGAPVSMPGMMDTILNLGLNDATVKGLAEKTQDPRFAYDCYRRFVAMYGSVVMGVTAESEHEEDPFAKILTAMKTEKGVYEDSELGAEDLKSLVASYKIEILKQTEVSFPEDPMLQLWGAIKAVFRSWNNDRAIVYRRANGIDSSVGTAVTVQAMVFGNMGENSATGVAFTRNPSTGAKGLFGELLFNAQGEDVVAGIRTPKAVDELFNRLPDAFKDLKTVAKRLEDHFKDMQDLEFTVQRGTLWLLQTRRGKRSGKAMIKIAYDMVQDEMIDPKTAVGRIDAKKLDEVLHPTLDPENTLPLLVKGLPASPGAAIGSIFFTASEAEEAARRGEVVLLVRMDTSPEDIHGMNAAVGILTARGGMTSHAAVVARGMGKPCVTACPGIKVDAAAKRLVIGTEEFSEGDVLTLDGSTGEVFAGPATLIPVEMSEEFTELMGWVDEIRRLRVRTNADTAVDAKTARAFGAEGIGLCRTEHMFFDPKRINAVRSMILAANDEERRKALDTIVPMQREDFEDIFRAMDGFPVTIRLLDPPLHEFLPRSEKDVKTVAAELGISIEKLTMLIENLHEENPMLGHRGCRLAIRYPDIYKSQTKAIVEAAMAVKEEGVTVIPEIMIPFVSTANELEIIRAHCQEVVDQYSQGEDSIPFLIGTMIELPRACLAADSIAHHADFFSFGTNDLTQTTFGLSRDDAGKFLPDYLEQGLLAEDPFAVLDTDGVGTLLRIGVEKGRASKTKLKIGICGEHGGEPSSVEFCHREGFDYVSCSPFRVPVARVAAAHAALRGETRGK